MHCTEVKFQMKHADLYFTSHTHLLQDELFLRKFASSVRAQCTGPRFGGQTAFRDSCSHECVFRLLKRWMSTWSWPRVRNWSAWFSAAVGTSCHPRVQTTTATPWSWADWGFCSSRMATTSVGITPSRSASGVQRWWQVPQGHVLTCSLVQCTTTNPSQ